jgi:hypothetical protein
VDQGHVRKVLLEVIEAMPGSAAPNVLQETAKRLDVDFNDSTKGQVILTSWSDLFRSGLLAWGADIANPYPPAFHVTTRGREALKQLSRDPSNPVGYLAYLDKHVALDPVARSYLTEALHTYNASCFKASAVMVGAAAERLVLRLRSVLLDHLTKAGWTVPAGLRDWKVKAARDSLAKEFELRRSNMPKELAESLSAYWSSLAEQIRKVRTDAGHPESIDPITPETVHAALLIFPELAKLALDLEAWMNEFYK